MQRKAFYNKRWKERSRGQFGWAETGLSVQTWGGTCCDRRRRCLHEAAAPKLSEQKGSKRTVLSQGTLTFSSMSDLKTLIINQPKNAPFCPCKAGGPEKHFLISLNQRLHQW